jgi:hypothetical protein
MSKDLAVAVGRKLNSARDPFMREGLIAAASNIAFGGQFGQYTKGRPSNRGTLGIEQATLLLEMCPTYAHLQSGRRVPAPCRSCDGYNEGCRAYQTYLKSRAASQPQ